MSFILEISGDLACFTRPELKVERVSYPVITPSAARNILMAILWKPAIRWRVLKIEILKPIQWTNIRRNEVGTKMSERSGSLYIEDNRHDQRSGRGRQLRQICRNVQAAGQERTIFPPTLFRLS